MTILVGSGSDIAVKKRMAAELVGHSCDGHSRGHAASTANWASFFGWSASKRLRHRRRLGAPLNQRTRRVIPKLEPGGLSAIPN
jgi:hypothetical protein